MATRSLLKQLSKESMIYGVSSISTKMISFVLFPLFARKFSPDDYGVINILNTLNFFTVTLCSLGLDSAATRWFYDSEDESFRKKVFSNWFVSQASLVIFSGVVIMILGELFFVRDYIQTKNGLLLLSIVCINMLLALSPSVLNMYLILNRRPSKVILFSISSAVLSMACCVFLVFKLEMGLVGFYLGQTAAFFTYSLIAHFLFLRKIVNFRLFDWLFLKKMIKYGITVVPAQLSNFFLLFCTGLIIHSFTSQAELGYYQVAATIATCLALITGPFGQAFQPISFSIMKSDNAPRFYAIVLDVYVSVMSLLCLSLALFYPELIKLLLTSKYSNSATVSGIITFSTFIYSLNIIAVIGMAKEKKIYYYGIIVTVTNILMIVLVYFFTKYFKIAGTAWAFLLGQSLTIVFLFYYSQKVFFIPYKIFQNSLIIFLALAGFIWVSYASADIKTNITLLKLGVISLFLVMLSLVNRKLFLDVKNYVLVILKNNKAVNE